MTKKEKNLGGTFVKKILVMGESVADYPSFRERAAKMAIEIIDLDQQRKRST